MVLKLYGLPMSTCTRRVALVLKYIGVPYELVLVDLMKGAHKMPAHLALQPFGQVPCLDDDGFLLFESRAICRYLAAKYAPGKLVPQDPHANALFEQAASVETANFDAFASKISYMRVFMPMIGQTPDPARIAEMEAALDGKLDGYERILSKHKYLAGDEITLADLFHIPYGYTITTSGTKFLEDTDKRPNVARWWKSLVELPAWQAVKDGA